MTTVPPPSLVVVVVLAALSAVLLTWIARERWASNSGGIDGWSLLEDSLGLFFVIGMIYASVIQILARYVASEYLSFPWTEELSRLLLIWTTLWAAAALQRHDDHISMTVIFDWLPAAAQKPIRLLGDLVVLVALLPVAWYGWQTAYLLKDMFTVSLGLPMSVFVVAVPLGGTLMILHTIALMIRRLRGKAFVSQERSEAV